jgi:hypothetical protein
MSVSYGEVVIRLVEAYNAVAVSFIQENETRLALELLEKAEKVWLRKHCVKKTVFRQLKAVSLNNFACLCRRYASPFQTHPCMLVQAHVHSGKERDREHYGMTHIIYHMSYHIIV